MTKQSNKQTEHVFEQSNTYIKISSALLETLFIIPNMKDKILSVLDGVIEIADVIKENNVMVETQDLIEYIEEM